MNQINHATIIEINQLKIYEYLYGINCTNK